MKQKSDKQAPKLPANFRRVDDDGTVQLDGRTIMIIDPFYKSRTVTVSGIKAMILSKEARVVGASGFGSPLERGGREADGVCEDELLPGVGTPGMTTTQGQGTQQTSCPSPGLAFQEGK